MTFPKISEIISLLEKGNPDSISTAARYIWTGSYSSVELENLKSWGGQFEKQLQESLNDRKERNVWHLCLALGTIQHQNAIDMIFELTTEEFPENIRGFAVESLGKYSHTMLESKIINHLWELGENDTSLVVRVNSIRAIGSVFSNSRDQEISVRLFKMLSVQQHSAVRGTIFTSLGELADLSVVPDLIHIMITRRTPADKKIAGLALDRIANLHEMKDRNDLIKSVRG